MDIKLHKVVICLPSSASSSPGVYNVLLAGSQSVAVEDDVTISTIEVTIEGRIHWNLIAVLYTPDLEARRDSHWRQALPKS